MSESRTALVTGSNGGLGRAIVEEFASHGFSVLAHARCVKPEFTEFIEKLSKKYPLPIVPLYFDLTDIENMKKCLRETIKSRPINILVNNAGVAHGGFLGMTSMTDMHAVFDINFFAPVELSRFLLRHIAKRGHGCIINMASILGIEPDVGGGAYASSKAALIAFTKVLAAEAAPLGVRANAIAPGLLDTEMGEKMDDAYQKKMITQCDMARKGEPCEIARVARWLASDDASFVNGSVIRVDGGRKW